MTTTYHRKYKYWGHQNFTFIFSSFPFSQPVNRFSEMDSIFRWLPGKESHPSRFLFIIFPIYYFFQLDLHGIDACSQESICNIGKGCE